ncbi:iron-containing alcohol dehydrogenase [Fundicoccus culcitae]|uniref:Iron-containing alcohol dehydrogenase n=1 Tax=Fundicoccus culcitae TaxID=2969821 RepID=A0ABY5P2Q0_9LACT|nr:iron-containing alcohol dehydrogenase [Fundicoccus culcitae]UUX32982.1 iron-containing alcohol dehydrogenase [Fundicoccus culcitae]
MKNFIYDIPTKLYFGKNQIEHLPNLINEFGKKVLLTYGGGSIKRNGLYDTILALLPECEMIELAGIEPNPRIETVRKGAELCKTHDIDVVLAVGGGSTIDASKVMAAAAKFDGDPWELVKQPDLIQDALPLIDVLTLSATGTEMNASGVITNFATKEKIGTRSYHMYPYASICDPTYTFSVSKHQTAAGTADIMSHTFEIYFSHEEEVFIQDRLAEGILNACIHYLPIALQEPENYDARANLMWASTLALNGLTSFGKGGPWTCHPIEHVLSAYYDITHAVGLAILTPRWMAYILNDQTVERFAMYAEKVWNIPSAGDPYAAARLAIDKTYQFFLDAGLPMTLPEVGITSDEFFDEMATAAASRLENAYVPLNKNDVVNILQACMEPKAM